MSKKYTFSEEAVALLCGLVREGQSAGDLINDSAVQSTSTYSSLKLTETLEDYVKDEDMTVVDMDALEEMLGLTTEELEALASLIDDTQISLNKVWSSSKTYTELTNTLDTAKQYTLHELSKAVGASYKVVTSTSDMTDAKVLYLMKTGSTYGIYVYDEDASTAELIGDFSINLDDYYTKTEADAQFVKQTDLTANYATKEELEIAIDNIDEGLSIIHITKANFNALPDNDKTDENIIYDVVDENIDLETLNNQINNVETEMEELNEHISVLDQKSVFPMPMVKSSITDYVDGINEGFGFFRTVENYTNLQVPNSDYTYTCGFFTKMPNGTSHIQIFHRAESKYIIKKKYMTGAWSNWFEFAAGTEITS